MRRVHGAPPRERRHARVFLRRNGSSVSRIGSADHGVGPSKTGGTAPRPSRAHGCTSTPLEPPPPPPPPPPGRPSLAAAGSPFPLSRTRSLSTRRPTHIDGMESRLRTACSGERWRGGARREYPRLRQRRLHGAPMEHRRRYREQQRHWRAGGEEEEARPHRARVFATATHAAHKEHACASHSLLPCTRWRRLSPRRWRLRRRAVTERGGA